MRDGIEQNYQIHEFSELTGVVTVEGTGIITTVWGCVKPQRALSGYAALHSSAIWDAAGADCGAQISWLPLSSRLKQWLDRAAVKLPEALRMQRQALQEKQKLLARAMKAIAAAEKALDSGKTATPRNPETAHLR